MSDPISAALIKRPIFRKFNVQEMVERLEPTRHDPKTTYEFSNGRRFKGVVE